MNILKTLCCFVLLCWITCGCGGAGPRMENLVTVSGTVTLDGEPLSYGTVGFAPVDSGGQPARGEIKDGKFKMVTTVSSPGVVAGNYKVLITSFEESTFELPKGVPPDPNNPPPEPASLIPKKYGDIKTSGLEVSVEPGMSPVEFDLESTE